MKGAIMVTNIPKTTDSTFYGNGTMIIAEAFEAFAAYEGEAVITVDAGKVFPGDLYAKAFWELLDKFPGTKVTIGDRVFVFEEEAVKCLLMYNNKEVA
jgi:hypothetical protein